MNQSERKILQFQHILANSRPIWRCSATQYALKYSVFCLTSILNCLTLFKIYYGIYFHFLNLSRFQNCIFCILHCILYILAGMMTRRQLELINLIIYTVFKKNYLHSRSRFPHSHPLSQTYSFPKIQKELQ